MKKVKRLYSEFKPERYEIYLEPNREAASFSGRVTIAGRKTGRPSRRLTLHQKNLKIVSAKLSKVDKKGSTAVDIDRINTHNSYDELRLHGKDMVYPGKYIIEIEFSGKITEPMHGIYPCNFELDGAKKQLIATQFESHHAREVFPCIDEPEAKAVFNLSLRTPANETVISNTPPASEKKDGKTKVTKFEDTPIMSVYLLAFVYGELAHAKAKTKGGTAVAVYATPDKANLTAFALDVSVRSLEFFEDYFGVPYPLEKLDVIGLPDFSAGAMENWGLLTFREQALYVDPKSTGIETKQFVATVVAHEMSHQWFGNLVTMKWWNDLWLNESFANLMEYRAVDELFPEWRIWEEFTAREMGSALVRDALPTVQAVRTEVNHPDELSSLFDPSIVYAKGGCLLNMVRHLIGEPAFREGLKTYFEEFKYSNTEAGDLWKHLGKAGGFDIESLMRNWLNQPGYPLVEAKYDRAGHQLSLAQQRITIGQTKAVSTTWEVPLAPSWEFDKPILDKKSGEFSVQIDDKYPLVLNHNAHSYFIARYTDQKHFESILDAAKNQTLNSIDRLLLVQSYLLMERAGQVPTTDNLHMLQAFAGETEEAVWSVLAGIIAGVRSLINKDEAAEEQLNQLVQPLIKPLLNKLGWDTKPKESSQTQKLRALVTALAAASNNEDVIKEGLKRFANFSKPSDLPPDIRGTVYFIAVRHGTSQDFDKLVSLYLSVTNAEEKQEIAAELTATRQPERIKQLLLMLTSKDIRPQDLPSWFVWLMRNRYATDNAWKWLTGNWEWVEKKFGSDKSYDRFPRYAAMAFSYPKQLADYKAFFEPKQNTALERAIKLGVEEIEGRVAWRSKNEQPVKDWLSQAR